MSVTVSLTFDTDHHSKERLLAFVMDAMRDYGDIQPASVHAYTDDEVNRVGDDVVHLVASEDPTGANSSVVAFIGQARASSAHAWAEEHGGVVVELPIDVDCRKGDQA